MFFELDGRGKLFIVNGYPDPEINVQSMVQMFPNSIFFCAELTTEEKPSTQIFWDRFHEIAGEVNAETGLNGADLYNEVARRMQDRRWGQRSIAEE